MIMTRCVEDVHVKNTVALVSSILICGIACAVSRADIVTLSDGQQLEGQLTFFNGTVVHLSQKGHNTILQRASVQRIEFSKPSTNVPGQVRSSPAKVLSPGQLVRVRVTNVNRDASKKDGPYFVSYELLADVKFQDGGSASAGSTILGEVSAQTGNDGKKMWIPSFQSVSNMRSSYYFDHGLFTVVKATPGVLKSANGTRFQSPLDAKAKEEATKTVPLTWMHEGYLVDMRVSAKS